VEFEVHRLDLLAGGDARLRQSMAAVVLESNMAGLTEFDPVWYTCVRAKMERMTMCADWIGLAMEESDSSGFNPFEAALVAGAAAVLPAYHTYYEAYLAAVQDAAVTAELKARPPPPSATDIHSSYTVVRLAADGAAGFSTVPFAVHFAQSLVPVLAGFDRWIDGCVAADCAMADGVGAGALWDGAARLSYIVFLRQYRRCLTLNADPTVLEAEQVALDRVWMDTRMPIQLIHDIETGYGDPLRCKVRMLGCVFLGGGRSFAREMLFRIHRPAGA
jgi:hypothetical protein